jgi:hypothetical protein
MSEEPITTPFDAIAARSRRMGILCTWLTGIYGAAFIPIALLWWHAANYRSRIPLVLPLMAGAVFILLAIAVSKHKAGAVDVTAILSTSIGFIVLVIGVLIAGENQMWIAASLLWCWTICTVVLVWKLYFFQRMLRPPAVRPRSGFEVIVPFAVTTDSLDDDASQASHPSP